MNRVIKRYLATLTIGIAFPALVGGIAYIIIEHGESGAAGLVGGIMIVGSFVATAILVAREKGRSYWYGLAGWIAPLLVIVLLLPHTKKRREELMRAELPSSGSSDSA